MKMNFAFKSISKLSNFLSYPELDHSLKNKELVPTKFGYANSSHFYETSL